MLFCHPFRSFIKNGNHEYNFWWSTQWGCECVEFCFTILFDKVMIKKFFFYKKIYCSKVVDALMEFSRMNFIAIVINSNMNEAIFHWDWCFSINVEFEYWYSVIDEAGWAEMWHHAHHRRFRSIFLLWYPIVVYCQIRFYIRKPNFSFTWRKKCGWQVI